MGLFGHTPEIIMIFVVALLIFGPKKLPEMGSAIGKSIKEFRKGMNELTGSKEEKEPSAVSLEAIEREIARKKITHDPVEVHSESAGTVESTITESKVD